MWRFRNIMFIQNITFFALEDKVPVLLQKIRSEIIPALSAGLPDSCRPRLAEVELPEGNQPEDAPRSISLQFDFPERNLLEEWQRTKLMPLMDSLHKEMGEEGLVFPTVLRILDI